MKVALSVSRSSWIAWTGKLAPADMSSRSESKRACSIAGLFVSAMKAVGVPETKVIFSSVDELQSPGGGETFHQHHAGADADRDLQDP